MGFKRDRHHRRSIRLKGYDYTSPGAYFITICTYQRQCLFGEIINGEMQLNKCGQIAAECWNEIPNHFRQTKLDNYVIMPNHIHGILVITDTPRRGMAMPCPYDRPRPHGRGMALPCPYGRQQDTQPLIKRQFGKPIAQSIPTIIGSFKSAVTKRINIVRHAKGTPVWQRNYYDHIIRDDASMQHIRHYIQNNPRSWQSDQLHPKNPSKW